MGFTRLSMLTYTFAFLIKLPSNVHTFNKFFTAKVSDISRYTLAPLRGPFTVENREHCLSLCSLGDECRGFAFTSLGTCYLFGDTPSSVVVQGTYALYIKDFLRPDTSEFCGTPMDMEELSKFIFKHDSCKSFFILFKCIFVIIMEHFSLYFCFN